MDNRTRSPRIVRLRDLAAGSAVLISGLSLINAVWTQGSQDAVNLMILAFGFAGVLIIVSYTFGAVFDRIARYCPNIFRPRQSGTWVIALVPFIAAAICFIWSDRTAVMARLTHAIRIMLDRLTELSFA